MLSDNQHVQGLVSETTRRPIHNFLTQAHAANRNFLTQAKRMGLSACHDTDIMITRQLRRAAGPLAPKRRRPKRVAKKLAQRGGMLRCRGTVQTWYRTWPVIGGWLALRGGRWSR